MTTSFPFLKIARDYAVPYGDVLRRAEARQRGWPSPPSCHSIAVHHEIETAIFIERNRRRLIEQEPSQ